MRIVGSIERKVKEFVDVKVKRYEFKSHSTQFIKKLFIR